jgi:hypothetical protein
MSLKEFAESQTGRRVFDAICKLPGLLSEIVDQMKETNLWLKRMHNATPAMDEPIPYRPSEEPQCICHSHPFEPEESDYSVHCPVHGDKAV